MYIIDESLRKEFRKVIGKLIRDEKDRGIAVILDRRASRFRKYLGDLKISGGIIKDIRDFLEAG